MSKPKCLKVQPNRIPVELASRPQWVPWSFRKKGQKWEKVPVGVTGKAISITERGNLMTLEAALAAGGDGVGFVFCEDPLTGIDLDQCRDPETGAIEAWAQRIIDEIDSYVEVSPSGTGVKLFVEGEPPVPGSRKGRVEIYSRDRYFTVTGHALEGPSGRVEARQDQLVRVHAEHIGVAPRGPQAARARPNPMTDVEIVERVLKKPKYARLWEGDAAGYPSRSEADMALCGVLAYWAGPYSDRIEGLFDRSPAAKLGKWGAREDYRTRTIKAAIDGQKSFYMSGRSPVVNQEIQESQDRQELQDLMNTLTPTPGVDVGEVMDRPADAGDAPAGAGGQGGDMAVDLALALVESKGHLSDYEASFALARRFRALSDERPEQYLDAVLAFSKATVRDPEDFAYAYLTAWEKVRIPEGQDSLTWAERMADEHPYDLPTHLLPPLPPTMMGRYGKLASMAWHLHQHQEGSPFFLPRERVADMLKTRPTTISNIVDLMLKAGLIRCSKEEYNFRGPKPSAKEYLFIDPAMAGRDGMIPLPPCPEACEAA